MFPLEVAMLPGDDLPLRIFEPRYARLVADCLIADQPVFGVVLIAAGREVGGGDERYDVGALARIVEHQAHGDGRYTLRCRVGERITVRRWLPDDPYPRAVAEVWPDEPGDAVTDDQIQDLQDRVMALFERIAAARGAQLPPRDMLFADVAMVGDAGKRLYALASRVPMGPADRYSVLAAPSAAARRRAVSEAVDTVSAMVEFQLSAE
ncbi:LON peptidase substrate-binding domain-containing protein [Mycobacterium sp.]|uniref:LON peptidase substrate-binding domain-containing protein n=1 Tax=Mycobacterium sp. TaxID=1785 RepID=UPI002D615F6C|nr:LON peptidase substrate-binding domain-containing protein [Mycobacterium sp.]HZA09398.1 LON peptidase substrate-binding domain-containing protein [Mycobacterium sp.]